LSFQSFIFGEINLGMAEYIESKTILSKHKVAPDPYFGITYSMNLFRGCQHQCIYCDSRSKVYGIDDFSKIRIKKNALALLEYALKKRIKKGTIGTGSMNDPYMPVEKKELLTCSALKLIANYRYPVHILTKSDLVTRDIDILQEINKTYAAVSFTITTSDDNLSKIIEPGAASSSNRFKALEKIAGAGLYCGVILTPVLPFITDSAENIRQIITRAVDCGAQYIIGWMGMTQREGQREFYYAKLDTYFPGIKHQYMKQFGFDYECSSPNYQELQEVFNACSLQHKLSTRMQFYKESRPEQLSLFNTLS
jgi:DNA repair photolyase